jgi:hypothetical protein
MDRQLDRQALSAVGTEWFAASQKQVASDGQMPRGLSGLLPPRNRLPPWLSAQVLECKEWERPDAGVKACPAWETGGCGWRGGALTAWVAIP